MFPAPNNHHCCFCCNFRCLDFSYLSDQTWPSVVSVLFGFLWDCLLFLFSLLILIVVLPGHNLTLLIMGACIFPNMPPPVDFPQCHCISMRLISLRKIFPGIFKSQAWFNAQLPLGYSYPSGNHYINYFYH